jgi:hypothetical protein
VGSQSRIGRLKKELFITHHKTPNQKRIFTIIAVLFLIAGTLFLIWKEKEKPEVDLPEVKFSSSPPPIEIHSPQDILQKRNEIIGYIWPLDGFPSSKLPQQVQKNTRDTRFNSLKNNDRIDKLTIEMDYGVQSIAYIFHPIKSSKQVLIYHQGHNGDFVRGIKTIAFFIKKKFTVIAFSMPLNRPNNRPIVQVASNRQFKLKSHDQLGRLYDKNFNPLKLFLEPIAAGINYLEKEYDQHTFYMVGISGGGWTTALYAALDPRIKFSFPVAGSHPLYLHEDPNRIEYEYKLPGISKITNYLELYVLGSFGKNRGQLQIFNYYDPICFSRGSYLHYSSRVEKVIHSLGQGSFGVYSDTSHKSHDISKKALKVIYAAIKSHKKSIKVSSQNSGI